MFESFLSSYAPPPSRYDEMVDDRHRPRAHWQAFLAHLSGMPVETMHRSSQFVHDAISSDGVSYNVYADPKGASRPWELDILPLILPAEEWRAIAAAVAQRARLLDAVIDDLYGSQRLLAEGLLPPALVFGQRSFLWPTNGIAPPGGISMHVYAADLARAPDGRWWVLADRTGGPSGAGYALQNRMTISRALPEAFRELHVEPLAPFFTALQDSLFRLSPARGEAPLAVLLTPGPYNETYFEHSFLARAMGIEIVVGRDLVVENSRVFMKTTKGLKQVDVIYRRIDDDFLDPTVFRKDSALGVPGIVDAYRAGNVNLANAIGTGVADDKVTYYYVPAMIKFYLGEDPILPNVETFLSAVETDRKYILDHLPELVVKAANESGGYGMMIGPHASQEEIAKFRDAIIADPRGYIAQPVIQLSRSPCCNDGKLEGRHIDLRPYILSGEKTVIIPGGLTRVAMRKGSLVVNSSQGGGSKDTWVLDEEVAPC